MHNDARAIYILGIAGTGTGSLAGLLQAAGHLVSGVDSHAYPPMRDKLREWNIPVLLGYDAGHLDTVAPDLVVVGNVIRRDNVEAACVRERNLPSMSMPEAIAEFAIGKRHSVVITGTHGKTTTTALCAHLLGEAGLAPGFLLGGALVGQRDSFAMGEGPFVIEGDEYDTAYFDKGPKFLHYRAQTLVITSLEFDHADIYADVAAVERSFAALIAQMAAHGLVIVWHGAHRARALIARHGQHLRIWTYGTSRDVVPGEGPPTLLAEDVQTDGEGLSLRVAVDETATGVLPGTALSALRVGQWGEFGALNTLAAIAVAISQGAKPAAIDQGLRSFRGVRRRLELRGDNAGRLIVDDFAHHPTAVAATLAAARQRFVGRRLWAIFEPRSATSRRNIFFAEYLAAFAHADVAVVANHARLSEVPEAERFVPKALVRELEARQVQAFAPSDPSELLDCIRQHARPGDVLLVLSNGDFDGLIERLLALDFSAAEGAHGRS